MIWFVVFVPIAIVLCFIDLRDLPMVEVWIAAFAVVAVVGALIRKRLRPGIILTGITVLSLVALFRMR